MLALGGGASLALAPATMPADEAASKLSPEQLEHARRPISYFNAKCSSCHGDYGNYWGEGFAADKTDKQLREVVDEMCAGPAGAPLEGKALDVQVAYHRSLVDNKPFVSVFSDGGKLAGEATPGSAVTLRVGDRDVAATLDGHRWTSDAEAAESVTVRKDGRETMLRLGEGRAVAFSHAAAKR